MNIQVYLREGERLEREFLSFAKPIRKRESLPKTNPITASREVLPSGCILYRLQTLVNCLGKGVALANSSDERIALETLKYLTDRAYGRARQSLQLGGDENGPMALVVKHIGSNGEQDELSDGRADGPKTIEGDPAPRPRTHTSGW